MRTALIVALTVNYLATANRAALNVASPIVQLTLHDSAIMIRTSIGTPIISFTTIPDPLERFTSQLNVRWTVLFGVVEPFCHGARRRLTMRLSDAGLRQRRTKALYPNHRPSPWLIEDAPRDRSNRLLDDLRNPIDLHIVNTVGLGIILCREIARSAIEDFNPCRADVNACSSTKGIDENIRLPE